MNLLLRLLPVAALVCVFGCAPNTVYFSEGTVLGFRAEFKPDASEPVSTTLAYKHRIVTVVPPKHPAPPALFDWFSTTQNVPRGEALSVISTFSVDADIKKIAIQNNFLSGVAAQKATRTTEDTIRTLQAVTAPETLSPLSDALLRRQHDLYAKIDAMNDADARALASKLNLPLLADGSDARFRLQEAVLQAQNDASLKHLEDAFNK